MSIHPCTKNYADALIDPFGPVKDKEVCLPATLMPLPSWKYTTRTVINWATGPGGMGFVLVQPGASYTSNGSCFRATNNTYPGTPATAYALSGTGFFNPTVNSPYGGVQGSNASRVRLVTWGSKTMCTTAGLNRGGRIIGVHSPVHGNLVATVPSLSDSAMSMCMEGFGTGELDFRFNGGGPVDPTELEFQQDDGASPGSVLLNYTSAIWATSSTLQTFTSEFIFYWETIPVLASSGGQASTALTMSHADPGPSATAGAIVASQIMDNPGHMPHGGKFAAKVRSMVNAAWQGFQAQMTPSTVKSLVATALRAAGIAASAYTGGASNVAAGLLSASIAPKRIAAKGMKK